MSQPKTTNQLMRHLRDDCNININGSVQKQQLINYGYYHGYKGYRFVRRASDRIPYTDFSQIVAVIEFDSALKVALYPELMYLENAIKSIVCNTTIKDCTDASFEYIFREKMNDQHSSAITQRRLILRNNVYNTISNQYKSEKDRPNKMIRHFYNRGEDIPIWALFEILTLGDFASFVSCLNQSDRARILDDLGIHNPSVDTNCDLLSKILYTIKPLRNAVAHNNVIFDARMKDDRVNTLVINWLEGETGILNLTFYTIIDFIILVSCMLKKIDDNTDRAGQLIQKYISLVNELNSNVTPAVFDAIIQAQHGTKIQGILDYLD